MPGGFEYTPTYTYVQELCAVQFCMHTQNCCHHLSHSVTPAKSQFYNVKGLLLNSNMGHFKSPCINKLITGVICASYNYLPVKHPALSLTFLFLLLCCVFHLYLLHELGTAL